MEGLIEAVWPETQIHKAWPEEVGLGEGLGWGFTHLEPHWLSQSLL